MKKKRNISKITIAFALALSVILTFVSRFFLTSAINKKGVYASESKSRIHYIILDSDGVASTNSEAIVIESNGHFGLIDASNYSEDYPEEYKEYTDKASGKQVIKYLEGLGATHLDFIIGSHAHSDHIGGLLDIANDTGLINEDTIYIYKEYIFNSNEEIKGWDNIGYYQRVISELSGSKSLCVNSPDADVMRDLGHDGARLYKEKLATDYDDHIDFYCEELKIDKYTLTDIVEDLEKPNRDPRDNMPKPVLRSDVLTLDDLSIGMKLQGTVRNVVDFGAFIDIGLHNDGLVHISKITNRYIKHPSEVLSVGDIIDCYVLDINKEKQKVSLTLIKEGE